MNEVAPFDNKEFEQAKKSVEDLTKEIMEGVCQKTERDAFILVQALKAASTTPIEEGYADDATKALWIAMDEHCTNPGLGNRLYADYLKMMDPPADIKSWSNVPITLKSSDSSALMSTGGSKGPGEEDAFR